MQLRSARLQTIAAMWDRIRTRWLIACGVLANRVGWPLIVRPAEYSSTLGVKVSVRRSEMFTVVTVNGIQVFFRRLTGRIDGVGLAPSAD